MAFMDDGYRCSYAQPLTHDCDCAMDFCTEDMLIGEVDKMAIDADDFSCAPLPSMPLRLNPSPLKRKYSELSASDEQDVREDVVGVEAKAKVRRTEDMKPLLGKSNKFTVWISCLLGLDRHELVPCRVLCKEPNAWMVQLKENAELQGPNNSNYQKGFKFWVKWNGQVVVDEHLPVVHSIHRA